VARLLAAGGFTVGIAGLSAARIRAAGEAATRRCDEQRPGRDGCRRARALGAGGVERAV